MPKVGNTQQGGKFEFVRRHTEDEAPATLDELSERQQRVLRFVADKFASSGTGPSVREVGDHVGWSSPSSAQYHIDQLIDGGWLERDADAPRLLRPAFDPQTGVRARWHQPTHVPLLAETTVAATAPLSGRAEEHQRIDVLPLPEQLVGSGDLFMLRMGDDSMADVGIDRYDYVVTKRQRTAELGDLVVAGIGEDAATVRRFRRHGDTVALEPANSDLPVVVRRADEVTVYGKVVAVLRKL